MRIGINIGTRKRREIFTPECVNTFTMRIFKFLANRFQLFFSSVHPDHILGENLLVTRRNMDFFLSLFFCPCCCCTTPTLSNYITAIVMEMEAIDVFACVCSSTIYMRDICTRRRRRTYRHENESGHLILTRTHFVVKSLPIECHALRKLLLCYRVVWCGVVSFRIGIEMAKQLW